MFYFVALYRSLVEPPDDSFATNSKADTSEVIVYSFGVQIPLRITQRRPVNKKRAFRAIQLRLLHMGKIIHVSQTTNFQYWWESLQTLFIGQMKNLVKLYWGGGREVVFIVLHGKVLPKDPNLINLSTQFCEKRQTFHILKWYSFTYLQNKYDTFIVTYHERSPFLIFQSFHSKETFTQTFDSFDYWPYILFIRNNITVAN